jgi:hypothetical protein
LKKQALKKLIEQGIDTPKHTRQELEELTRINEYGKWCAHTGTRLGVKPQLAFGGSSKQSEWASIRELSDDEAMRIHEATKVLTLPQITVIRRMYIERLPFHATRERMKVGTATLDLLRMAALTKLWEAIIKPLARTE